MNVHEVAGLLSYFGSAWPKTEIPDDTADVWAMELEDVNIDVGRAAAKLLVRSSTFMPSIAEFLDACRTESLHRRNKRAPELEPAPDSEPDFDFPAAAAQLRDQLKNWSTRGHNHKGPEPCPVCAQRLARERA